jgi:hypothetical protein
VRRETSELCFRGLALAAHGPRGQRGR